MSTPSVIKTTSSSVDDRWIPEIIETVVNEVVGEPCFDDETGRIILFPEEMRALNAIAQLGSKWVPSARYYQSRALLATRPWRGELKKCCDGLMDVLGGEVPSTFTGLCDSFFLDMWEIPGVHFAVPLMFWRQPYDVPVGDFRRESDPYLAFLGTSLPSGQRVGEVLYSRTDRLWIKGLPYPNCILGDELACIARSFQNITRLEITKYWSLPRFEDAVTFLQSFRSLEDLQLQTLFLVKDDEELAWKVLDSVAEKEGVLSALKEIWVPDVFSPYNMLALLATGSSFPRLKKMVWITEGHVMERFFDRRRGSWRRLGAMLQNVEVLNITMENEAVNVLGALELADCRKVQQLGLFVPESTVLSRFVTKGLPRECLKELTLSHLPSLDDAPIVDAALERFPCLRVIRCYVPWNDHNAMDMWERELGRRMPRCASRGMLVVQRKNRVIQ